MKKIKRAIYKKKKKPEVFNQEWCSILYRVSEETKQWQIIQSAHSDKLGDTLGETKHEKRSLQGEYFYEISL